MAQQSATGKVYDGDLSFKYTVVPTGATGGSEVHTADGDTSYVEIGRGGAAEHPLGFDDAGTALAPVLAAADFQKFVVTLSAASLDTTAERTDPLSVLVGMGNAKGFVDSGGVSRFPYHHYNQIEVAFTLGAVGEYNGYTVTIDNTISAGLPEAMFDHYKAGRLAVFTASNGSSTAGTTYRVSQLLCGPTGGAVYPLKVKQSDGTWRVVRPAPPGLTTGRLKLWTGTEWVREVDTGETGRPLKAFINGAWVTVARMTPDPT